jgi:hypothetical protein
VAFVAASGARAGAGAATRRAGAGRAAARRRPPAAAASSTTTAEQQREAIQALKDQRAETPAAEKESAEESPPVVRMERPEPAPAGAGLVLGVLAWAVALNYIRGGTPQVRKLLRAKFLNKTD